MSLGIGIGISPVLGGGSGGAVSLSLPSGALGLWRAADYSTSPRKGIPNALGTKSIDANIGMAPRRAFTSSLWTAQSGTTDCAAVAPDGSMEASTLVTAPATNWSISRNLTLAAGTYTICVTIKDLGGDFTNFLIGQINAVPGTKAISASWQRISYTFTLGSQTTSGFGIKSFGAGSQANFAFCDIEIFAGSADLHDNPLTTKPLRISNGDIIIGFDGTASPAFSNGELTFSTSIPVLWQLPVAQTPTGFTWIFTGTKQNATVLSWESLLSQLNTTGKSYTDFLVGPAGSSQPELRLTNSAGGAGQNSYGLFGGCQKRGTMAITYDGTTQKWYVNGAQVAAIASSRSFVELRELLVGSRLYNTDASSFGMAGMAVWPRALSTAEIQQAAAYMEQNLTMPSKRLVVLEGDSITFQQTPRVGFNITTKGGFGWDTAIAGATIAGNAGNSLVGRATADDAILASAPAGTLGIITALIGANDLTNTTAYPNTSDWIAAFASWCDARRAAGWKVVVCTVLPRDSQPTYNSRRATVNSTITGSWLGVHCDAIADYAADPIMGPDNSFATNPSKWTDQIHPNAAGHDILVPILAAAIESL